MTKKDLKLNIKNTQIAEAINLDKLKNKLAKKKADDSSENGKNQESVKKKVPAKKSAKVKEEKAEQPIEEAAPRRKARSKSVFAEKPEEKVEETTQEEEPQTEAEAVKVEKAEPAPPEPIIEAKPEPVKEPEKKPLPEIKARTVAEPAPIPVRRPPRKEITLPPKREKLGPTGRHVKDLLPKKRKEEPKPKPKRDGKTQDSAPMKETTKARHKEQKSDFVETESQAKKKFKEFRDLKPARKQQQRSFDARDRHGYRVTGDEDQGWRRRRGPKQRQASNEETTIRPSELSVRIPISVKDLAAQMKLKASQLISKLFMQGLVVTINDFMDDETTIQLLGHEFGCEITIDTSEEERIRITDKTIREEVLESDPSELKTRAPVVTFMGHVDHGKTSLIDSIRKSDVASGEAGAITQHIGAFKVHTSVGDIAILDTPGHEAFTAMRARGADVTDIVVLVIAGNEGIRAQTSEAIEHAKMAGVTIVVAINKCDTPNFDAQNVYRQLADAELLPEAWGGETITVNCSAKTGEGIPQLLEMLALQAEVLELRANPKSRARGSVLESEMHKGMGTVATILVQNGTLRKGDAVVFEQHWGRIKTMRDEHDRQLEEAGPSTPIEITGLSGIPEAGQEFIVVKDEKEARDISEARSHDHRLQYLQQKKMKNLEALMEKAKEEKKKVLKLIVRADVQGSLEAVATALQKIKSDKAELQIIHSGVGEVSESDVELAAASSATILGFHTQVESHAESVRKQLGVTIRMHDIIYHAIDDVKEIMTSLLDKIEKETDMGLVEVRAIFKSSQLGIIAGCFMKEGYINQNHFIRQYRDGEMIWKGPIASLKREKQDVKEVKAGLECGILLKGQSDIQEGDTFQVYEISYIAQEL